MPTREEIKVKMGLDATSLDAGMTQMMQKQKQAADMLKDMWAQHASQRKMMSVKEAEDLEARLLNIEVEGASRRNRARELMRQREKVQAERHARDMAQVEAGFVPETWRQQAVINEKYGKKYGPVMGAGGQMVGMNVASSAAEGLLSGKESGKLGKEVAAAAVEGGIFAVVYELIKSAFKIASKNLGKIGFGAIPAGAVPIVGAGILGSYGIYRSGKQMDDANAQLAGSGSDGFRLYPEASGMITDALSGGRITFEEARRLRTGNGGWKDVRTGLLDFAASEHDFQTRQMMRQQSTESLKANFASRDALGAIIKKLQSQVDAHNFETVSISDIAGRDFSKNLAAQYGEGGAFDLAGGKGKLAAVAQEYEKARYAQMWNRMNGNKEAAKAAQERMNKAEGILADFGATSQKMDVAAMRRGIDRMTEQLNNLGVRIVDVEEK